MDRPMTMWACGTFEEDTTIKYRPCDDGDVELTLGGAAGLNLMVSDGGLTKLADTINAARTDERRLKYLNDPNREE